MQKSDSPEISAASDRSFLSLVQSFAEWLNSVDASKCASTSPIPRPIKCLFSINLFTSESLAVRAFGSRSTRKRISVRLERFPDASIMASFDVIFYAYFLSVISDSFYSFRVTYLIDPSRVPAIP